jgi:hypothetical protein
VGGRPHRSLPTLALPRLIEPVARTRGSVRGGVDVCSADVGAAAAFAQLVDFDDQPPLPAPGLVDVLSTWVWQEGHDTRWWLGALMEARSATSAAERVASVVEARTAGVRRSP